ncbi:hypothetical protein [Hymenobacter terricola]|uniref:hypothetical protein n=1 Tax=Hymenobacter terricola TaxID=2819236 RepID=UPI001B30BC00|nr:hypothetical protein [Hymenobacter terricola]
MGCLLKVMTAMFLTAGALLWLVFLGQLYEKMVHPNQKNLNGEQFFLIGLVLAFFTVIICLGLRSRSAP